MSASPFFPYDMRIAPTLPANATAARPETRRVLLINPFYPKDPHASFGKHVLTPSLALTSIAAATPPNWEVSYWDENLLQGPPPLEPMPQVVGITVHLTFAKRAYALARWYRDRGAIVILGGLHATACREEVGLHADVVVTGEGVAAWPQVLIDIENDRLQPVYSGSYKSGYSDEPAPKRDLLPRDQFLTTSSLIATRGCHNRCGFCYLATKGLHMPYRMREPAQVADEIRADNQPYVVFTDNNLGSRPDYLFALCEALKPLDIIWSAAITIDVTDDPALVRSMALAGCTGVFVGLETLHLENLTAARKRTPEPSDYGRRVALLHDHGIQVNGSFVFGFDHDRADVFQSTVDWIERHRLECATFHILTPYPGTPLFRQLESENRLLHRDWDRYDTSHVVFRPRNMSVECLQEGYRWSYRQLFSHRSIWRRKPEDWHAVPAYYAMSYLYKRSNRFWHLLIRHRKTAAVWRPLIELSRRRHLRFRERLNASAPAKTSRVESIVSAGV